MRPINSMECLMRRLVQLSMLCFVVGIAGACSPDEVVNTEDIPTAGVRFINAVPDTGAAFGLDLRFVDLPESNSHFRISFRNNVVTTSGVPASTQIQYKNTRAGQRHFRIFLDDTISTIAQTVLKDSTVTIEAGKLYTFLLWGNARSSGADKMRLTIIDESVADPGANVALRVINATESAIDVSHYASTETVPGTPTWANVEPYSISTYATAPPSQKRFNVAAAGGGAALFTDPLALIGAPATVDVEALPGTTVAGSAVTAIVFPRSVDGSLAPQTAAFDVPAVSFMWDRRPPRSCSPVC
jgi:hypothetical protein